MIRQRVYQIAAGYEDCNDADHLRIDPVLRLAIGKEHKPGASQSMLSRWPITTGRCLVMVSLAVLFQDKFGT